MFPIELVGRNYGQNCTDCECQWTSDEDFNATWDDLETFVEATERQGRSGAKNNLQMQFSSILLIFSSSVYLNNTGSSKLH